MSRTPSLRPLDTLEPRMLLSGSTDGLPVWAEADGGNGHAYEAIVVSEGVTWLEAQADALSRGGYLTTLTSAEENAFVYSLIDDPQYWFELPTLSTQAHGPWIGAMWADPFGGIDEGWAWESGEAWSYTNWNANEPNKTTEPFAVFHAKGSLMSDQWSNWVNGNSTLKVISYVVEYDEVPGQTNTAPTIDSAANVSVIETLPFEHLIMASDLDGDALSVTVEGLADWMSVENLGDGTLRLTGDPAVWDAGDYELTVTATDGEDTATQTLTVAVQPIGQISGTLWRDVDIEDLGDPLNSTVSSWLVYADANNNGRRDMGEAWALTNAEGRYTLQGVTPGEHIIRAEAPVDLTWKNDYELRYRIRGESNQRGVVSLNEPGVVLQSRMFDGKYYMFFNLDGDFRFDELVLRVEHSKTGEVDVSVVHRQKKVRTVLREAVRPEDGSRRERFVLKRGRTYNIVDQGLTPIFPTAGYHVINTQAGDQWGNIDFTLAEDEDEPVVV